MDVSVILDIEQLSIAQLIDLARDSIEAAKEGKDKGVNSVYYAGMETAESFLNEAAIMIDDLLTCHKED